MLEQFLATARPRPMPIEIDGTTYYMRPLSGTGRGDYLRLVNDKDNFSMGAVVLLGLCGPDGELLGDAFSVDDRAKVDGADGGLLQRLADKMLEASGLVDRSAKAAEKKSEPSPSALSGTD